MQKRDDERIIHCRAIRHTLTLLQVFDDPVSNAMFRNATDYEKLCREEAERKILLYKYLKT